MNSDSYFEIGASHLVCQDYALSGCSDDKRLYYTIISDGCSGSKNSEIGAQILCHIAKYYLLMFYRNEIVERSDFSILKKLLQESIYKRAEELRILYNLDSTDLDATLFISCMIDEPLILEKISSIRNYVFCWGDGFILCNYPEQIEGYQIEYESGAPFYLSYLNKMRFESYKKSFDNSKMIIKHFKIKDNSFEIMEENFFDFFHWPSYDLSQLKYDNTNLMKSIVISSDGLSTFKDENKKLIPMKNMVNEFLGYKRITGEFVKSNMLFMRRRHQHEKKTHFDDISCGIIVREKNV